MSGECLAWDIESYRKVESEGEWAPSLSLGKTRRPIFGVDPGQDLRFSEPGFVDFGPRFFLTIPSRIFINDNEIVEFEIGRLRGHAGRIEAVSIRVPKRYAPWSSRTAKGLLVQGEYGFPLTLEQSFLSRNQSTIHARLERGDTLPADWIVDFVDISADLEQLDIIPK